MPTCQSVVVLALAKLGILGLAETPEAGDLNRGLASLRSYYQKLINSGTFDRLIDSHVEGVTEYEARENERITHDGTVTVILPTTFPLIQEAEPYGEHVYEVNHGRVRPPMDLSIVSVVNTTDGNISDFIYDNRVRRWCEINGLNANAYAPLSHRDEDGLASALALRLQSIYGQQATLGPEVARAAVRYEEALVYN